MEEPVAGRRTQGAGSRAQDAQSTEYGARNTKHAILNTLSGILLLATVAVAVLYLLIALRPTVALNPFPPPTACPSATATPTAGMTATPAPTPTPFPTPTALRLATLTPTPEMVFPFTATVKVGPLSEMPDCRATLRGAVLDREGHGLEGYPVHLWAAEADFTASEMVLFSDRAGRWQAVLPTGARGAWYVQLHAPDAHQVYPPLSAIVVVGLPESCPQVYITFHESRFPSRASP